MDNELRKIAPFLHEQRQQDDGFKRPDDYFETLEDRVFGRIEAVGLRQQPSMKVLKKPARRFSLSQILMAAAAVFTLVLAATWFYLPATPVEQPIVSIELSEEEIENYVLENVQDFEAEQLAMLPEEDENEYLTPRQPANSKAADTLNDIRPEDVEHILNDMTEEELEEIL